jgi:DNA-binding Lrp family transcriptional regulator
VTLLAVGPEGLDIDILREMYRDGLVNLAGIDPRLNATQIARRLHVGRARVSARLKVWKEAGFIRQYDVWLNPALLGWVGGWINLQVDHHRVKPELFRRLGLVDGVVSALEFLGDWISVGVIAPDELSLRRRVALVRGLAGVREVEGPTLWKAPEPRRPLTPLDLRILHALRANPTATLSETARRAGISTRTMTRRYSDLVDDWAVWFVPVFDFTALISPVVSLNLTVRPGTSQEAVVRALRQHFPFVLESRRGAMVSDRAPDAVILFVTLPSAASFEELHRVCEGIEGVLDVEQLTMVRMHSFPAWFDRQLEALMSPRARSVPPRRAADTA